MQLVKTIARVCARNYSGVQFTALSRGLIPGPSPVPGPAEDWGDKLRGSCRSMNSQPLFRSVDLPRHICVKWVH